MRKETIFKECINPICNQKIPKEYNWCSLECKEKFLLDNYSIGNISVLFKKSICRRSYPNHMS